MPKTDGGDSLHVHRGPAQQYLTANVSTQIWVGDLLHTTHTTSMPEEVASGMFRWHGQGFDRHVLYAK